MRSICSWPLLIGVAACAGEAVSDRPDDATDDATRSATGEAAADRRTGAPADFVLHAGKGLQPIGFTDDDHVFYQDGQTVYESRLEPGSPRTRVADVPNGNVAFMYNQGIVAFIWTNPDMTSPSFGVSPLVIWTARYGAHLASDASAVGTFLTSATRDGEHVVFPTHATAGGTIGDAVEATADLRHVTTLVSGIQTDFSNGPCRPFSDFVGEHGDAYPVVDYCVTPTGSSTLSTFRHGVRRDITGLVNPPRLFVDVAGRRLLTVRASADNPRRGTPLLVTDDAVTPIDDAAHAGLSMFGADGAVLYAVAAPDGQVSLRRARLGRHAPTTEQIAPTLVSVFGGGFGSNAFVHPLTSADGRWLAYGAAIDPAVGFDLKLIDLHAPVPEASIATVDPALDSLSVTGEEPFTKDSRFVLYGKQDPTTGNFAFFGASVTTREPRLLSDPNGFSILTAAGSLVSLNDNIQIDPANFARSVADLKLVDLAHPAAPPRVIAAAANIFYFLDTARTRAIYVTDDASAPGLHVARAN